MTYFQNITDFEQAKLRYRELAKQLHPDKGGSGTEFQRMQEEYKNLLIQLQNGQNAVSHPTSNQENDLLSELSKLAKVLIRKQVPQTYLKKKMQTTQSPLEKGLFTHLVNFLDNLPK